MPVWGWLNQNHMGYFWKMCISCTQSIFLGSNTIDLNISKVPTKLSFGKDFYLSPYISCHWDTLNYFILIAKYCFGGNIAAWKPGTMLIEVIWQNLVMTSHVEEKTLWSLPSLLKEPNPSQTLHWTYPNPITSHGPHLQIPSQWGLGLQHMNLEGTLIFSPQQWPITSCLCRLRASDVSQQSAAFCWCKDDKEELLWDSLSRCYGENTLKCQLDLFQHLRWHRWKEIQSSVGQKLGLVLLKYVLFCSSTTCHSWKARYLRRYFDIPRPRRHLLMHQACWEKQIISECTKWHGRVDAAVRH